MTTLAKYLVSINVLRCKLLNEPGNVLKSVEGTARRNMIYLHFLPRKPVGALTADVLKLQPFITAE